jgi:hypothetical protein
MKKHGNRSNVLKLKQRAKKNKRRTQVDKFRTQVTNYFYMEDEAPSRDWMSASVMYRDYVYECLTDGLNPCKQTTFAKIASDHLEKKKWRDGRTFYRPSTKLHNYLVRLAGGGEEVKKAA